MPKWRSRDLHGKGVFIMNIATVGLDLAKSVLQIYAVDSQGQIVVRKQLRRTDVLRYFALGIDGFQHSQIGATFVNRHRLGFSGYERSIFRSNALPQPYPDGPAAGNRWCCWPCRQRGTNISTGP